MPRPIQPMYFPPRSGPITRPNAPPLTAPVISSRFANHVLQTTRNGRKFEVDGKPLNLTVPFDTLNKKLVGHFDFRKEIKMYYFKTKCVPLLASQLAPTTLQTNAFSNVQVEEYVKLTDYFVKPTVIVPNQLLSDVTFVVDLGVDASSLETLQNKQLFTTFKSRRVVYHKRTVQAQLAHYFSRSRMMPPPPQFYDVQPQPIPQPSAMPYYTSAMPSVPPSNLRLAYPPPPQPLLPPQQHATPQPQFVQPQPYPQPYLAQPPPNLSQYPQPYVALPQPPPPAKPQIGYFRPVQPPPIISANRAPPQQQQSTK